MIQRDKLKTIVIDGLSKPISEWNQVAEELMAAEDKNCMDGSDYLCALSVEAGMLSIYLGYRGAFGCGDHGHEEAVKAAQKKRKALRKVNGYSYP